MANQRSTTPVPHPRRSAGPAEIPRWRRELATAITTVEELAATLQLAPADLPFSAAASRSFALRVPRSFVARMAKGNASDPLLLQVLPSPAETQPRRGYTADPLAEQAALGQRGLLQKYRGRALLITTGACAVHCRYCFRRDFPYAEAALSPAALAGALEEIRRDVTLSEVILSGGDPLCLSDERLGEILRGIGNIAHVRRIRLHTRVPVVLPERVDPGLVATLARATRPLVTVLHINHPAELDDGVMQAARRLAQSSAALLNQSVLLAGVNDTAPTLIALSERLFTAGILPYYLHQLDRVQGAARFRVSDARARRLLGEVAAALPGYLVPKLVRERPGQPAKELLTPALHKQQQVT